MHNWKLKIKENNRFIHCIEEKDDFIYAEVLNEDLALIKSKEDLELYYCYNHDDDTKNRINIHEVHISPRSQHIRILPDNNMNKKNHFNKKRNRLNCGCYSFYMMMCFDCHTFKQGIGKRKPFYRLQRTLLPSSNSKIHNRRPSTYILEHHE